MGLLSHETITPGQGYVAAKMGNLDFGAIISLTVLLVTLCLAAVPVYRIWFHPLARFPGPYLMSAIHAPFLYRTFISGDFFRYVTKLHAKYGPVVRIGPNHLSVDGSVAWPDIYSHRKGEEYLRPRDFFVVGDQDSIIGSTTQNHRRIRRQLANGFSDVALREQEHVIKQYLDRLFSCLDVQRGSAVDIVKWLNFTTFDIISDLAFNDSFHNLKNGDYHPWVLAVFQGLHSTALDKFLRNYPFLHMVFNAFQSRDEGNARSFNKAQGRIKLGAEPNNMHRDLVGHMMKKNRDGHQGMTTNEIISMVPTLLVAGSETISTAVEGILFYLALAPDALENLVDEVRSSFEKEEDITLHTTSNLLYLHACIKEGLRIYPPAADISPRESPGGLINGEYVPKGTRLNTFPWATFHNPQHFTDVEEFCPQRWLPDTHILHEARFSGDNLPVCKPFSYGPRDCIGKKLAFAEIRLIVSRFIYRFDYKLLPGQEDWHARQRTFILWDKGPLLFKLEKRKTA